MIGAGTMGSGIAAQVANAGLPVLLLDIASNSGDRNSVAANSLERIRKSDPPLLMRPQDIERIETGNIDDDLEAISDCDWIVEAIVERLEIKRTLYRNMLPHLKEEAFVSSNTSTIPISLLMEDMPSSLKERFCITHFFNPVRYMRLLELVEGLETSPDVMRELADFNDRVLGKGVVECRDTPGFLGNRVGVFAMQAAIHEATQMGVRVDEADAIFGRPMGIPKTGAFGLYDLIGLDLMADVVRSLRSILPQGDPFHLVGEENDLINSQIEMGFTGNKGNGGFYKEEGESKLSLDLASGEWQPRLAEVPQIALDAENAGVESLLDGQDKLSQFGWRVLAHILTYSASLVPEVTESPQDIDDAMKLGYNWIYGPFELIDQIGSQRLVERLEAEQWHVPEFLRNAAGSLFYRVDGNTLNVRQWSGDYKPVELPDGVSRFHLTRKTLNPIYENPSASLFHLPGGERVVEFHSKANALDADSMDVVARAAGDPGPGIIVHNDAQHFSAGVNLAHFLAFIEAKDWKGIDDFLIDFQGGCEKLLYCNAPVVGAPSGLAVGGGYEVLAHCDKVVAHANSILGLVETGVGLVPGGGGIKETYWRWFERTGSWEKAAWNTFNQVGYGQTGSSPYLSEKLAYFVADRDEQVMNRDRLIERSVHSLKELRENYRVRKAPQFQLAGSDVYNEMIEFLAKGEKKGFFFPHDVTVAAAVAHIVTGGDDASSDCISESDMYRFERENFIKLAQTPQTLARISAMMSGKGAIRN